LHDLLDDFGPDPPRVAYRNGNSESHSA
jgi:hypothetical protein